MYKEKVGPLYGEFIAEGRAARDDSEKAKESHSTEVSELAFHGSIWPSKKQEDGQWTQ